MLGTRTTHIARVVLTSKGDPRLDKLDTKLAKVARICIPARQQQSRQEADVYSYISATYVISCIIPTFVGLDICTLNYRDLFVINLNGKYPEISITDLRDI